MLQWVKSGLIFGVFSSAILMLCPNKSYYKHISLVVGLLFVLVMLRPIAELSNKDVAYYTNYVKRFLFSEQMESKDDTYIENYCSFLERQIEYHFAQKGFELSVRDISLNDRGEVKKVYIRLHLEKKSMAEFENQLYEMLGQDVEIVYV